MPDKSSSHTGERHASYANSTGILPDICYLIGCDCRLSETTPGPMQYSAAHYGTEQQVNRNRRCAHFPRSVREML